MYGRHGFPTLWRRCFGGLILVELWKSIETIYSKRKVILASDLCKFIHSWQFLIQYDEFGNGCLGRLWYRGKASFNHVYVISFLCAFSLKWSIHKVTNKLYWYFLTESGCCTSFMVEKYVSGCVDAGEVRILKAWDLSRL